MQIKDYQNFKQFVDQTVDCLKQDGHMVTVRRWRKESPYQKSRYKPEYVFPECWIYPVSSLGLKMGMGMVIVGDELPDTPRRLADEIIIILF